MPVTVVDTTAAMIDPIFYHFLIRILVYRRIQFLWYTIKYIKNFKSRYTENLTKYIFSVYCLTQIFLNTYRYISINDIPKLPSALYVTKITQIFSNVKIYHCIQILIIIKYYPYIISFFKQL